MKKQKEAADKAEKQEQHRQQQQQQQSQVHTQIGQSTYKGSSSERTSSASTPPTKSPRDSAERSFSQSDRDRVLSSASQTPSESIKQDSIAISSAKVCK